jgi:hypothetical protein
MVATTDHLVLLQTRSNPRYYPVHYFDHGNGAGLITDEK